MKMSFSLNARLCGRTDILQNGPCDRVSSLLFVTFVTVVAECVAVAESSGRSTNSMSHGVNVG